METEFAQLLQGIRLGQLQDPSQTYAALQEAAERFDNDRLFGPSPADLPRRARLARALDLAPKTSAVALYAATVVGRDGYLHELHRACNAGDGVAQAFMDLPRGGVPAEAKGWQAKQQLLLSRRRGEGDTSPEPDKKATAKRRPVPKTKPKSVDRAPKPRPKNDNAQHPPRAPAAPPGLVGWVQPKAE